jgi:DNA-binding MarR family transcriptional regulator
MDQQSLESSDYALWVWIIRAYRSILTARGKELRKCKISLSQNAVLDKIKSSGNYAKPSDIARGMFREPQTLDTIIRILLEKGLVETARDSKRKNVVRISLTDEGERVYEQSLVSKSLQHIMSTLTIEKRRHLQALLEEIVENAVSYAASQKQGFEADFTEE